MATKSISKNIVIKNKALGKNLVNALEDAKNYKDSKEVTLTRMYTKVPKDKIKDLFNGNDSEE